MRGKALGISLYKTVSFHRTAISHKSFAVVCARKGLLLRALTRCYSTVRCLAMRCAVVILSTAGYPGLLMLGMALVFYLVYFLVQDGVIPPHR
jgi:hypothetical protein